MASSRPLALMAALLMIAGCLSGADDDPDPEDRAGSEECQPLVFADPIMLGDAGPGALASEPSIAFGPDGTVVVASIWIPAHLLPILVAGQATGAATHLTPAPSIEPGGQNAVWVAPKGGDFVSRHDALGRVSPEGHQANQDADVAITPDGGIHLALFGPSGIEVLQSHDFGQNWSPSGLISPQYVDRQWIAADNEGNLVVSWNEIGTIANVGGSGDGIGLSRSVDSGASWGDPTHIHATAFSRGPISATPAGFVAVAADADEVWLMTSADGANWLQSTDATNISLAGGFVVPAASSDGTIHLVWTASSDDGTTVIQTASHRGGKWTDPTMVSPPGRNAAFPWPVAFSDGSLAVFSYQSDAPGDPSEGRRAWDLSYDLRCFGSDDWQHGTVMEAAHHGAMCLNGAECPLVNYDSSANDRSVGEVFEAGLDSTGRIWVTWTGTTSGEVRTNQIWVAGQANH